LVVATVSSRRHMRISQGSLRSFATDPNQASSSYSNMVTSDPTTQSNYFEVISEHVALDWHVDFDKKIISGSATHTVLVKESDVKHVM
jgi:hypothetical protein